MDIPALNKYYNNDLSSKTVDGKYSSSTEENIADTFKNQVLNWEKKNKEKIDEQLKNDRENNLKMSEKQWHALMNKVDSAIKTYNLKLKEEAKVDSSKSNNEDKNKTLYDDSLAFRS